MNIIDNLEVHMSGDIILASYVLRQGNTGARIEKQPIPLNELMDSEAYGDWTPNNPNSYLHQAVHSYFNQNLK